MPATFSSGPTQATPRPRSASRKVSIHSSRWGRVWSRQTNSPKRSTSDCRHGSTAIYAKMTVRAISFTRYPNSSRTFRDTTRWSLVT
ncbi:Uncharacterised protein [Mycobacteroides abscessus subsp. abscessus]|nr:Uncharacterised protein [Mycobacteroides abscessus subsp. abscessus]